MGIGVLEPYSPLTYFMKGNAMSSEDVVAGKVKQIKGKANNAAGAITGNTRQQLKGKAQELAGKVQEAIGKATQKNTQKKRPIDRP
jgi:uncharacterized protein YjbJ (UPF0337 family)